METLEELQKQVDEVRRKLAGTEEWEFITDIRSLKSNSPKAISYRYSGVYNFLRDTRFNYDGNKCTKCGCKNNLQLHHLTYKNYFKELLTDVITLCKLCHEIGHNQKNLIFARKKITLKGVEIMKFNKIGRNRNLIYYWLFEYYLAIKNELKNKNKNTEHRRITKFIDVQIGRRYSKHGTDIAKIRQNCGLIKTGYLIKIRKDFESFIEKNPDLNILEIRNFVSNYLTNLILELNGKKDNLSKKTNNSSQEIVLESKVTSNNVQKEFQFSDIIESIEKLPNDRIGLLKELTAFFNKIISN